MPSKDAPLISPLTATGHYSLDRPKQDHGVSENLPTFMIGAPVVVSLPGPDQSVRRASLFRNGRNQAVRIPREFEFPAGEVNMYKEGNRLMIEPVAKTSDLAALFASWEPLDDEFPDVDDGLLPQRDVSF